MDGPNEEKMTTLPQGKNAGTLLLVLTLTPFLVVVVGSGGLASAQPMNEAEQVGGAEDVGETAAPRPDAQGMAATQPSLPWPLTTLAGLVLVVLLGLFLYRMFRRRAEGTGRGIDEIKPRVLIGGMLAVLLLYGFFFTLYHLLEMLPKDNSTADEIPGEYWLFIGQALGILGSLALNVATYYFGSSSSGEDEQKPAK